MQSNYLDLKVDRFDSNGIESHEIEALISTKQWALVEVSKDADVEVSVRFKNRESEFYTQTGKLAPGTQLIVNEGLGIGIVVMCRNNIESDWRSLEKLYK